MEDFESLQTGSSLEYLDNDERGRRVSLSSLSVECADIEVALTVG